MIAGDPDHGMQFMLSAGHANDFIMGKKLIEEYTFPVSVSHLVMDRGYSSYQIFSICNKKNIEAVVPPRKDFNCPWEYDKNLYLYRNEIERLFNRLKNFRRIATRYDKLDTSYTGFIFLGLIALLLKVLC